jgi:hypothetical protein
MKKILLLSLLSVVGFSILASDGGGGGWEDRARALYPFEGGEGIPTEDFEENSFDYDACDVFGLLGKRKRILKFGVRCRLVLSLGMRASCHFYHQKMHMDLA